MGRVDRIVGPKQLRAMEYVRLRVCSFDLGFLVLFEGSFQAGHKKITVAKI